jgi:hypothetical protein
VIEKLALAFRLMQDDDQTNLGSTKFTILASLLAIIIPWLITAPLLNTLPNYYQRKDSELLIVVLFFSVLIFPARISFFSARAVMNVYFSPSQSWLSLTEITNQQMIWAYTFHALYQVRRLLFLGIMVPMGVLLNNRVLDVMPLISCRLNSGSFCAPLPDRELPETLILIVLILSLLVGLYFLAASVGVHAALRHKTRGLIDAASFVDLVINVVMLTVICIWLFISGGNPVVIMLGVLLPYLLALIILRIARSWLWKPARRARATF